MGKSMMCKANIRSHSQIEVNVFCKVVEVSRRPAAYGIQLLSMSAPMGKLVWCFLAMDMQCETNGGWWVAREVDVCACWGNPIGGFGAGS